MKDKVFLILIAIIIVLLIAVVVLGNQYKITRDKLEVETANVTALVQGQHEYQVRDSLNAVKVNELTLTLNNYKQFHEEDVQLLKDMGLKLSNVHHVVTNTTETTYNVETTLRDSVIFDTLQVKTMKYHDPYLHLDGYINEDTFKGTIASYDTLKIVEKIKYKRFLGFLWKTNKIKEHEMHAVSKNPHTHLTIESIDITH